ncbi:MAG: V-type ATP synthase subunit A [Clostridiales bacterium]|jgi:V/A-type H+-transporting ATPase subunit A|nr:V-type ATP synthase subunit A [Clostridiales bacterium]
MNAKGQIHGIDGSVIRARGSRGFIMGEMVKVGAEGLIGEVIGVEEGCVTIQVFENTTGLRPGDAVTGSGKPLCVTLGPGIISNIFDGIERPLRKIEELTGKFIARGAKVDSLDMERGWDVTVTAMEGDIVSPGGVIATVPESASVTHKIMVPPGVSGEIVSIRPSGPYTLRDPIAVVKTKSGGKRELYLWQEWPIRAPRPVAAKHPASVPLITGQRIIDTLFPIAKGGTAAVPGGFGTGKTMTQHQIAKWSDADIIIYIGCGERGNEMTQVLEEFTELIDPRGGRPLMDRTMLIANTSNMPVAAREASIYTGITIAEYYRDMGCHVAIMADSTSRWAEALRELSGRLEEMPAEEGFPAYLSSRLAAFYERAAYVRNLNGTEGSVSIIGAVSPQGGDFSEPVTQNTKRFVKSFWTLDRALAYARHFPAINWLTSYSEYTEDMENWYDDNVGKDFSSFRRRIVNILTEESRLMEIVKLIGADVLPDGQRLTLEIARVVRLGFIQQNAYHKHDTYVPMAKQRLMMELILYLYDKAKALIDAGVAMSAVRSSGIFERIIAVKFEVGNDEPEKFTEYKVEIDKFYDEVYASDIG